MLTATQKLGDERGFTLVELLVAMIGATVVIGALFTVVEVSLHQSARIAERVQADQLGRTAMTKIVEQLHSACLAREFAPVQEKTGSTTLWFVNAHSKAAVIERSEAYEHKVELSGATLKDYTYQATAGEWPKFTFSSTASPAGGTVLGTDVTQTGSTPVFSYYKYATQAGENAESGLSTLSPLTPPKEGFSAAEAQSVAAVAIAFTTAPTSKNEANNRKLPLSTEVTFAFSAPAAEATIKDGPCQ